MGILRDQLVLDEVEARLRSHDSKVSQVVDRLQGADSPASLIRPGGLTSAEVIACLAQVALGGDDANGPTLVQTKPRRSVLSRALAEPAWVAVFPAAAHRARLTMAAGLLQVHDFWESSHQAAQRADDLGEREHSAYWHGIAHRREPDAGNAAYWFRRVGSHPVFKPLADAARPILDEHGDSALSGRLISGGAWNAMAMIDLCTDARPGTPQETLARRLQRVEMWLLLEATYAALGA
jgi:hypothetical protein